MSDITVLADTDRHGPGSVEDGRPLVLQADLRAVTGWELKPEGLCQGDICVPVADRDSFLSGDRVDIAALAEVLDRPAAVAAEHGVVAWGEPRAAQRSLVHDGRAPAFDLPDLDGGRHTLDEWKGTKKLLFAFASW